MSKVSESRLIAKFTNSVFVQKISALLQKYGLYRAETAIVGAAVVLGILGSLLQHANQAAFERNIQERYAVASVLGASTRLDAGTILKKEHFTEVNVLTGTKTKNMIESDSINQILGRPLQISLAEGDIILLSMINTDSLNKSVSSFIPQGKRLYTMIVTDPVAQSGFVRPGDFVDIISTMDFPGKGVTTFYLMSAIQLTAVEKSLDPKSGVPASQISFMVSPKQMEALKYAEGKGQFSISLRNPEDREELKSGKGTNQDTFLSSDLVYSTADQPVKVIENAKPPKK